MKKTVLIIASFLATNCLAQEIDLESLSLPDGFSISIYAEIENPRQLALGSDNTVFVGSLRSRVWAITNPDGNEARIIVRIVKGKAFIINFLIPLFKF